MRSDPPYADAGTDEAGSAATVQSPERWLPSDWIINPNEYRTITRRRLRLVGAAPGSRILVVGCGRGDDVLTLARLVRPGGRAFGVDLGASELADARRRAAAAGLSAKFHHGASDDLPFPDASFDGVCAAWLSATIRDSNAALAEMIRAARPGGRIVIDATDWAAIGLEVGEQDLVQRIIRHNAETRVAPDRLARENGLVNLTTTTTPTFDRTGTSLRVFAELANAAATAGAVTASDAAHLKADLAEAVARNRYVATLPCITLAGERP